jgi:hypothetical protein
VTTAPPAKTRKKRRDNFAVAGPIKVRWHKLTDGRTIVDPRRYNRKRVTFTDHAEALREARRLALEIYGGGAESTALTAEDRAAFAHASAEARRHGADLVSAVSEWSAIRSAIHGSHHSVADVVKAGLESLLRIPHPTGEVFAELMASKAPQDLNGRYRRGLEKTLGAFARALPGDIRQIKAKQIDAYLQTLGEVSARRRDNVLKEIRHGFQFARLRGYLPDEISEARKVPLIAEGIEEISFFTVTEMRLMLEHVRDEWRPFLVLACFAGIRTEELALSKDASKRKDGLRWDDFDWEEREIHIRSNVAKVGRKRIVPMQENLYEWLQPWRDSKATGLVAPPRRPDREFGKGARVEREINQALKDAPRLQSEQPMQLEIDGIGDTHSPLLEEFAWRSNALRHSYGSYRASVIRNLPQLAEEMGNSIEMIKRHYCNPRPKSQARAWFNIFPAQRAANIIDLARAS